MYHFLQFKPNKKEAWRMYDERQLSDLEQPPAFITVLKVDQDPENFAENGEDPLDHVKYMGPMYLDFDGPELDVVLDDVREVLIKLTKKLDIEKSYIHCWLSGQKGVHLTIPARVFGLKNPVKALPLIYREIAAHLKVEHLDMSVYSAGRGRMWRCENIARPGAGTFKVGVTFDELMNMDSEMYATMVAQPRPPMSLSEPSDSVIFPKAESLLKTARAAAQKRVRAMKGSSVVPKDKLRELEEIPGCVQKLLTEGDCPSSNWNQAAMQVAAYIAARYERAESEEYTSKVVEPFVKNVESSTRPTIKERRKHVEDMLNRAFSGRIKFLPGPLISVIEKPCGDCIVCRGDFEAMDKTEGEDVDYHDKRTGIAAMKDGYALLTDSGNRKLTTFTFWPHTEVFDLEDISGEQVAFKESPRQSYIGLLIDDKGDRWEEFEIPESSWGAKRSLISTTSGIGSATVVASDADIQPILRAIQELGERRAKSEGREIEKMVRTQLCGVLFDRRKDTVVAHYVEDAGSSTSSGKVSRYFYSGDPKQSPKLLTEDYPYEDGDTDLEQAIYHLCNVNEPHNVAAIMGWFVACHFREHIQFNEVQFPLLNISGNASAGKTSLAILMSYLNGMDYTKADFMNVEVSTIYPLIRFVSSSSTVPRLVEEVNPSNMAAGQYGKILGILKAAWNRAPVPRGRIVDKGVSVTTDRVSSPIVYTSEQTATVPSLRSRTVEVKLTSKALTNPAYRNHYAEASRLRFSLMRMAKALVTVAVNLKPSEVLEVFDTAGRYVPDSIGPRPKWGYQTALAGLHLMGMTMDKYKLNGRGHVDKLYDALADYLQDNAGEMEKEKSVSEVDRVLASMNQLADDQEDKATALRPGHHYWRKGDMLYLVIAASLPRYCRYAKILGDTPVIKEARQMTSLLEGEVYFDRKEAHPYKEGVDVHVLSIEGLRKKGTTLTNFQDGTEPEEN